MKKVDDKNEAQEKPKPVRAGRKKTKRDPHIEAAFAANAMHCIAAAG